MLDGKACGAVLALNHYNQYDPEGNDSLQPVGGDDGEDTLLLLARGGALCAVALAGLSQLLCWESGTYFGENQEVHGCAHHWLDV